MEIEASSPEIITFMPESNASSGTGPLEDIQGKLEQEGIGENPEVFLSKTPNNTDSDLEVNRKGSNQTQESDEGSGESSGEKAEIKPELLSTNPTLTTDHTSEGVDGDTGTSAPPSEVKVTLIPHQTPTPGWDPEPSSSAEPPVTEESGDVSKQQETTVEITTSSINGEFKGIFQNHT